MPRDVRTHTRRTASGKTTTVNHHTRRGSQGQKVKTKRGPNPGHAGKLSKRAMVHGRRGRKGKAAALGLLALTEVVLWMTLGTTSFLFALTAGVLMGLSILLVK